MASIAQLLIPSDGLGGTPTAAIADWTHGKVYIWNQSTPAIRAYNAQLATQSPIVSAALSFASMRCGDADPITGNLIVQAGAGSNGIPLQKYNQASLALISTFGVDATLPSYPASVWNGESLVCVSCNGVGYALLKESSLSGHVAVIRTDTMVHAGAYLNVVSGVTNNRGYMCRGASGVAGASAFLTWEAAAAAVPLYKVSITPGAETYNPSTWPATNPHISNTTIGTIAATAIDPTWTTLTVTSIGYDAADGNVLLDVTTGAGPTNRHYIAKINATTAAVMWAVPVNTQDVATLAAGRINARLPAVRNGGFDALRLSDGVDKAATYNGVNPTNGVVAGDSLMGLMLLNTAFTQGTGSPVPVAGTAASFSGWAIADWPDANFPLPAEIIKVLLPTAELQFCDANGHPYAGGTLELLVPGTATPKDTWTDPEGAALNTNPITLDAAGRCIVYGDGKYRSILKDALGNLIWDRETTTEVSAVMTPVVGAPTIEEARRLLGIDDGGLADEIAAREAADAAETAARIAADALLQSEIDAEIAARIAADAALAAIGGPNVRAGSVTTNSSGFARITFTTPFPAACTSIVATPGGWHGPTTCVAVTNTPDVNGCDVYTGQYAFSAHAGGDPLSSLVYYIAVGN